jgi:hypothetical protein
MGFGKNEKCKLEKQLYDPEIASILMYVLGTIGALGGIVCTIDYIDRKQTEKKEYRFTQKRRKEIEFEISYSFRNISISIESIIRRIEFIVKICQVPFDSNKIFSDHNFSFGNCPILLDNFQFKAYKNEQKNIIKEIVKINNNVFHVEKLIAEIPYLSDSTDFIINKKLQNRLKQIIVETNNLMKKFGEITTSDFIDQTIRLCRDVEGINNLREERRNLL